jgi:2-methylisocitrate lyase-like PEP mutase family enzyme
MRDFTPQRTTFRTLHDHGTFVIPNPWDIGSARYLRTLGFKALATTSAGFGFSRGLPDSAVALSRDIVLAHIAEIVTAADDLPVNADFQSGYASAPAGVAESVRLCIATGVSGLSIEDATGNPARPLYDLPEALERLHAARRAIDASGTGVLLTARAECFLTGHPDPLNESIRRLQAYADAGADCLFAPGTRDKDSIRAIVQSVHPKPVNILMSANIGLTVADLAAMGVRRISLGSALARAAWTGLLRAAAPIAQQGTFTGLDGAATFAELNALFEKDSTDQSK